MLTHFCIDKAHFSVSGRWRLLLVDASELELVEDERLILARPVLVALDAAALHRRREHDDGGAELLPHALPEVGRRVRQRALCGDVAVDDARRSDLHLHSREQRVAQ